MARYSFFVLVMIFFFACKKEEKKTVTPENAMVTMAKGLAGERNWNAYYTHWDMYHITDINYALPDTTFTIIYVKDSTVAVGNIQYTYHHTTNGSYIFWPPSPGNPNNTNAISYRADSAWIEYAVRSGGQGGGDAYIYTTDK
jgi:hypothetical protein